MTTIGSFLQQFQPPANNPMTGNPWPNDAARDRYAAAHITPAIQAFLAWWAAESSGSAWMVSLIRQRASGEPYREDAPVTVDHCIEVLRWLGFKPDDTAEAMNHFTGRDIDHKAYWRGLAGWVGIDTSTLPAIDNATIVDLLMRGTNAAQPMRQQFKAGDGGYRALTEQLLADLLDAWIGSRWRYLPGKRDCDDYASAFKGWLSAMGYGDLAVGAIGMVMIDASGKVAGGHEMVVAIVDGAAVLIEPMDGQIKPRDYAIGGAATNRTFDARF